MQILFRLLVAVEVVVCLLLIGIVLIQRSKGQGAGLSFGGGAEAVFGAQMGNVLTRTTVVLGIIFLLNTLILAVIRPVGGSAASVTEQAAERLAAETSAESSSPDISEAASEILKLNEEENTAGKPETQTTIPAETMPEPTTAD